MSSGFEKSVKGGTKVKLAPPKSKYVEHILLATQSGEAGVAEVFRTLIHRLRDSTWTVAFKSLIIVHLMIKEGAPDVTLRYLAVAPENRLAVNTFTDVQTQGQNIRHYSDYLLARAEAYAAAKCDFVSVGDGRMKKLTVDKGLLRETEIVQRQIRALVRCDFLTNETENEISLTAFRLLTRDLLDLYNVENEAVMNVLGRYFEMSRPDAERAIEIYKAFCKQTDAVVQYLSVARQYEHATRLEIPKIKHAPTSLANSLQDYLNDPNFETNRRQYMAEQEAKRTGKPIPKPTPAGSQSNGTAAAKKPSASATAPAAAAAPPTQTRGPAPDLIDFFASIEQNQQPMAQSVPQFQQQPTGFPMQNQAAGFPMQAQQTGFVPQQQPQPQPQQPYAFQQQPHSTGMNGFVSQGASTNPFGQPQQQPPQQQQQQPQGLQTQFTGAGFGGYGPQPQQQQQSFMTGNAFSPVQTQSPVQAQPPPQPMQPQMTGTTNPFRHSAMPTGTTSAMTFGQQPLQRSSTNPFARSSPSPATTGHSMTGLSQIPEHATTYPPPHQQTQHQQASFQPIQPQATGTNPFARNTSPPQQPQGPQLQPLQMQATGSTNPFRQSAFVNQQTGQGWQSAPQATMGGLEHLETIPVFPRPGQGQ
ncbi:hypothetical protein BAUCODRAFT_51502, partial [Baudoinia panamericana UAMH 10762]